MLFVAGLPLSPQEAMVGFISNLAGADVRRERATFRVRELNFLRLSVVADQSRRFVDLGLRHTVSALCRGNLHDLLFQEWARQGDVAYLQMGPYEMTMLSDPVDVKHVLQEVPHLYGKKLLAMQKLLGDGISNAEGAEWRKHRLHLKGHFSYRELGHYFPVAFRSAEKLVRSISTQGTPAMDLEAAALSITQDVIFGALFGEQPEKEQQDFTTAFKTLVSNQVWLALLPAFMASWPTPWALSFHGSLRRIDSFVSAQIMTTSRSQHGPDTILSRLMGARDKNGAHLFSEKEVRDNVVSLMLAGYETTAATICWTLATLSSYPQHSERLQRESRALVEEGPPSYADLAHFHFGRAVINEVLRLYPPGWSMRRIALQEDVLPGGAAIHRGDFILISPYILHRHPAHWPHPHEFRPERFEDEERIKEKGFAFMPFGGGPRRCLGMNFAYMELLTVLLSMSQQGSWHVSGPSPIPIHSRGTMKPATSLSLHWTP